MINIGSGNGKTEGGPGISIELDGNELAHDIDCYLYFKNIIHRRIE